jgi:REP element-mobilizing transposase RayT
MPGKDMKMRNVRKIKPRQRLGISKKRYGTIKAMRQAGVSKEYFVRCIDHMPDNTLEEISRDAKQRAHGFFI